MAELDLEAFLNKPIYCLDVIGLLVDVEDFLELSEENIETQKAHELRLALGTVILEDDESLQNQFRGHLIENANYRFDVSLSQRVRYAGLTALITTVDWCVLRFQRQLTFTLPETPRKKNTTAHVLSVLNEKACLPYAGEIEDFERLIHVRNCIVHAAGILDSYEHKGSLRDTIDLLDGISLSDENFLGLSVAIDKSALPSRIRKMKNWLPSIDEQCTNLGLLVK
ncbi:MAG: hypothetical protein AB7O69_11840 [Burkholderiales bacterium]